MPLSWPRSPSLYRGAATTAQEVNIAPPRVPLRLCSAVSVGHSSPIFLAPRPSPLAYCLPPRFNRAVHFRKIVIAGVGLLGGSLGLAVKQRGLAAKVDGLVRRSASITECDKLGVVDHATRDPLRAAENADFVVLCTPIARMREVLQQILPALKRDAIVTDVGSAKASVVLELEPLVAGAGGHFVGSHPMAGAETMGPGAARPDLFVDAVCVITPTPQSSPAAVTRVEEFWEAVGANPLSL